MSLANHHPWVVCGPMGWFYNLIIPLIGVALTGWNVYYQREAVRLMRGSAVSPRARAAMAAVSWWKTPQVALMVGLMLLTWVPFGYGLIYPPYDEAAFADEIKWGGLLDGAQYMSVILKQTKQNHKIILVVLHYSGLGDIKDQTNIEKSEPYDYIKGLNTFIVDPNENFRREVAAGKRAVSFLLLDVPAVVPPAQFSTIRQAIALGGSIVLTRGTEPPR